MLEDNVHVYIIDMPCTTNEFVTLNEDGTYSLFLNARCSYEEQCKSYKHALRHIRNNDFAKSDVQEIEMEGHKEPA